MDPCHGDRPTRRVDIGGKHGRFRKGYRGNRKDAAD